MNNPTQSSRRKPLPPVLAGAVEQIVNAEATKHQLSRQLRRTLMRGCLKQATQEWRA